MSNRPLFWAITGRDFSRSIAWSKTQINTVSEQIGHRMELKKHLEELAAEEAYSDRPDYNPGDGGNHDDTFRNGQHDGQILMARRLLKKFFPGSPCAAPATTA